LDKIFIIFRYTEKITDLHSDFSTHKNNGPLLNIRDYYRSNSPYKIYGPLQSIRITADPIHHKKIYGPLQPLRITADPIHHIKSTDYSSPYGLLQIQFATNNLQTTPNITDLRMFNL